MELVHMIRRVYTVSCSEGAKHLGWQFQIDHVDYLVAIKAKLASRDSHYDGIPLAVICMPEHCRFKVLVKRIVR